MDTQSYIIDPEGDVIITLRNFDALDRRIPIPELGPEPIKDKAGVPGKPPVEGGSAFDNILPTRVEPPAPEASVENSIGIKPTADSSVEPSKRTIQLQVSSAHLRLGSLYFKKVLDGRFKESQLAGDSLRHISAEDWDADAFLIVMRIMHGQNRFVPRTLDLETLANIAAIVDYYQCREMLEAFAEIWRLRMRKRSLPSTIGIDLIRFIFVSGVFRWPDEFNAVTKIAQDHSTGPLDTLGLPIPESIIVAIDLQRRHFISQLADAFDSILERFYIEPPECTFDCASMKLGALMLQLRHNKELGFHTRVDKFFQGYGVASSIEAALTIRFSKCEPMGFRSYSHPPCPLRDVVEEKVVLLGMNQGLNLKDFIQETRNG